MSPLSLAAALLMVTIWGFNFIVIRWGLNDVPPFTLSLARFVLAAFPAILFVPRPPAPWRRLAAYGLFSFALQFTLLFGGIAIGMPAGLASLVIQLQVFFTVGLAMVVAHERPSRRQICGAVIAGLGLVLVAVNLPGGSTRLGLLMVLAAGLAWAVGNVIVKRMPADAAVHPTAIVVWACAAACLPLAAAALLFDGPARMAETIGTLHWMQWLGLAFQAWPTTLLSFGIWAWLLRRYPAALVAPFTLLVPVIGMTCAVWLLNEPVTWWKLGGAGLVLGGLALNILSYRNAKPPA